MAIDNTNLMLNKLSIITTKNDILPFPMKYFVMNCSSVLQPYHEL